MECEDNLPVYSGHEDLISLIDVTGITDRSAMYLRWARDVAAYYNITLCDELDAGIVGWFANWLTIQPRISMDWSASGLDVDEHVAFLRLYQQVNNIPVGDIDEKYRFLIDPSLTTSLDVRETAYGVVWLRVEKDEVVAEIRRLTAIYSIPTIDEIEAELAAEGGTVILGRVEGAPLCVPGDAQTFKNLARARRNGHWSVRAATAGPTASRNRRNAMAYQIEKCGDREYSLRTDATRSSYAPLADGLCPTRPPGKNGRFAYPCLIVDAKYSAGPFGFYQRRRDYYRRVDAAKRAGRFVPPFLRNVTAAAAKARYENVRRQELGQAGNYFGAIADREIPYWRLMYICNTTRTASYFLKEVLKFIPGYQAFAGVVVSRKNAPRQNWIS